MDGPQTTFAQTLKQCAPTLMISIHFFRISGVPDLPEARGKLCASYDPSGNNFTYNHIIGTT